MKNAKPRHLRPAVRMTMHSYLRICYSQEGVPLKQLNDGYFSHQLNKPHCNASSRTHTKGKKAILRSLVLLLS